MADGFDEISPRSSLGVTEDDTIRAWRIAVVQVPKQVGSDSGIDISRRYMGNGCETWSWS